MITIYSSTWKCFPIDTHHLPYFVPSITDVSHENLTWQVTIGKNKNYNWVKSSNSPKSPYVKSDFYGPINFFKPNCSSPKKFSSQFTNLAYIQLKCVIRQCWFLKRTWEATTYKVLSINCTIYLTYLIPIFHFIDLCQTICGRKCHWATLDGVWLEYLLVHVRICCSSFLNLVGVWWHLLP